jgi:hypothetical protein
MKHFLTDTLHASRFMLHAQAVLSLVFTIGSIIVLAAATLAFVIVSSLNSGLGFRAANQALAVAGAGVEDALVRLDRNAKFSSPTPYQVLVPITLTPPVVSAAASVTVNQAGSQATIISDAVVSGRERKLQVIVGIDPTTGEANVLSWNELTL